MRDDLAPSERSALRRAIELNPHRTSQDLAGAFRVPTLTVQRERHRLDVADERPLERRAGDREHLPANPSLVV